MKVLLPALKEMIDEISTYKETDETTITLPSYKATQLLP